MRLINTLKMNPRWSHPKVIVAKEAVEFVYSEQFNVIKIISIIQKKAKKEYLHSHWPDLNKIHCFSLTSKIYFLFFHGTISDIAYFHIFYLTLKYSFIQGQATTLNDDFENCLKCIQIIYSWKFCDRVQLVRWKKKVLSSLHGFIFYLYIL